MTVRVKICGITRLEDALVAEDAGADAVGFIFVPGTKRFVTPDAALEVSRGLGPFIARVGVFRDATPETILETVQRVGLNAVQVHGADAALIAGLEAHVSVIRAVSHGDALPPSGTLHVDAPEPGSGQTFDWDALDTRSLEGRRWMLAGGLTPENVGEAVRRLQPWGVDVSSGVERAPGIKDAAKIRAFVRGARNLE
jgi:phosphoribosylanthranilate isomerase